MTVVTNSFEGGTNAATITTGNSGGLSGTAFSSATGVVYSNTRAAHGLISGRMTNTGAMSLDQDMTGTGARWWRAYLWSTSWSGSPVVAYMADNASDKFHSLVLTATQVQISHYNGSSLSTIATIAVAPATSAWIRVEVTATSATTGACGVELYNTADGTTPSGSATGARTQTAGAWAHSWWTNENASADIYIDDVGWSDEGPLGPAVASMQSRSIIGSPVAIHRAANW